MIKQLFAIFVENYAKIIAKYSLLCSLRCFWRRKTGPECIIRNRQRFFSKICEMLKKIVSLHPVFNIQVFLWIF